MPDCRFGSACRNKPICKFVHDPCKNPACTARGTHKTHDDNKCGVLDPSRSPEEQRQAHKDFIAAKREKSMAAKAAKKAKAAEVAPAAEEKPPDEGAIKLARDLAGEWLYSQIKSVLEDEDVAATAAAFIRDRPNCYAARPGINLAGSITGMHLETCNTLQDVSDLQAWSEDEVREAAMEGLETLFASPA